MYASVTEKAPEVMTTHGPVRGENRRGIAVFRGIPYGGNCDGKKRFLPPVPAEDWKEVRDCTKNGPIAMQTDGSISGGNTPLGKYFSGKHPEEIGWEDEVLSENCLVLNVLTPGIDEKKRPVVVYIHGGGFANGSGTLTLGADVWCDEEDIVVVGINHRLNIFGYLYLGHLDEKYAQSGTVGMLDCVLALQWVKDNIASFGGNPEQVTIMGESGGGMKVNHLLSMKCAQGLFQRAIVESGSGVPGGLLPKQAAEITDRILEELEIKPEHLKKICEVSKEALLEAMVKTQAGFSPVGDGINVEPTEGVVFPEVNPELPVMVGASEEETGIFFPYLGMVGDKITPENFTWDTLKETLKENGEEKDSRRIIPVGITIESSKIDEVVESLRAQDDKQVSPFHMYCQITSNGSFLGSGAYYQALYKAQKKRGSVYHYYVTYDAPMPLDPEFHCAWHTADLPLQMRVVQMEECEEISKKMAHSWAAFIRTGNPSTEELKWPQFTEEGKETMVWDEKCRVEKDPTKKYRELLLER